MAGFKDIARGIKNQYDRWIAFLVLLGLVASVLYLAWRIGTIRGMQAKFERQIESLRIIHPEATEADQGIYRRALTHIRKPAQIAEEGVPLFVPESRVWCVDCRRPIPMEIAKQGGACPFCNAVQPPDPAEAEDYDGDKDGIWDSWEVRYGLDPFDPGDAEKDTDGDDYSNIAEFRADPRTDPTDPESFPPPEAELRVVEIVADPFELRFRARSRLPDGSLQFQINLRGGGRTFFRKLGEEVQGFKLDSYEERFVRRTTKTSSVPREVDESVLTLVKGDRTIPLVYNKDVQYNEYTAVLIFMIDRKKYTVKHDSVFELKGKRYKVLKIDSAAETVVVERLHDNKQLIIRKFPERESD